MKYNIANRNLSLKISQDILDEMYSKALASFPNETGGMFLATFPKMGMKLL